MISRGKLIPQEEKRKSWHGPPYFTGQFMREQAFRAEVLTPFGGTAVAAMGKRCNPSCRGVTSSLGIKLDPEPSLFSGGSQSRAGLRPAAKQRHLRQRILIETARPSG
jgi:hypothetical protein